MTTSRSFASTFALLALSSAPLAIALAPSTARADDEVTPAADATAEVKTTPKKADEPPANDIHDVSEKEGKTYYYVGLRYRGDVVPKFMENIFVDGGKTIYSNSIGLEVDIRKDGYSLIPALTYTEYGTGDILFVQKGKDQTDPGNWSYVNSGLKAIYASVDLLWSVPVNKNIEFEYGFGAGIGVVFGNLIDNWVYVTPAGKTADFTGSNGVGYSKCNTVADGAGCNPADHQNATTNKVGGYIEKSWAGGGSVPNIFPSLTFPELGFRFKPIRQMEARVGLGFSLTGFWFGLSGDYRIEKREDDTPTKAASNGPEIRWGQR
jgi:hypothetical protein